MEERQAILAYLDKLGDTYSARADKASSSATRIPLQSMALAIRLAHDAITEGRHLPVRELAKARAGEGSV